MGNLTQNKIAAITLGITLSAAAIASAIKQNQPNKPFKIQWDYNTEIPANFRLVCNGIIHYNIPNERIAYTPLANGLTTHEVEIPIGLPQGNHDCSIWAWNEIGETKGTTTRFVFGSIPTMPSAPRIIK